MFENLKVEEKFIQMKQRILDAKLTFPQQMEKRFFEIYLDMFEKNYKPFSMFDKVIVFTKGYHPNSTFDSTRSPKTL